MKSDESCAPSRESLPAQSRNKREAEKKHVEELLPNITIKLTEPFAVFLSNLCRTARAQHWVVRTPALGIL
jgi:hypothetical protein